MGFSIRRKSFCMQLQTHYVYRPWASAGSIPLSAISFNSFIFLLTNLCPISRIVSWTLENFLYIGVSIYREATLCKTFTISCWLSSKKSSTAFVNSSASRGGASSYNPNRLSNATVPIPMKIIRTMKLWIYAENRGVKNYMKEDQRSNRRNFCSCGKESLKKIRLVQDSNPWPLRYWCSALTNSGWWRSYEYMKII